MTLTAKDKLVEAGIATTIADSGSESNLSAVKDDAYDLYKQNEDTETTEEEEKSVLRIIDMRVMPLLFFMYTLQYLDKNVSWNTIIYAFELCRCLTFFRQSILRVLLVSRRL